MMMGKQMPPSDAVNYWGILSSMPGRYIYEGYGIRRGMWTVSWFKDLLGEKSVFALTIKVLAKKNI